MRLKKEELKNKGKVETEVSKITKGELVEAFGITKDQMVRAAEMLSPVCPEILFGILIESVDSKSE